MKVKHWGTNCAKLLCELDRITGPGNKVKRGLYLSYVASFSSNLTVNDVTIGLDIQPERGAADSEDWK